MLSRPKLYFTIQTLVITDSNLAASSVMATSAQHQNKVFFIVCFIRSLVFPTTATLLLLGATVYLVFNTFHQESLMGFVPPAMVGLLSLIFLKSFQNKKGQKNFMYPTKKQSFFLEKDCFFVGCLKYFWPFLF